MNTVVNNNSVITNSNGEIKLVCEENGQHMFSRGIWWGDNPMLYVLPTLLLQLSLFVLVSRTINCILRPFKQPKIVCNILGGIILGPSVFGKSVAYTDILFSPKELILLRTFGYFGGFLYIFVACVKMDVSMITRSSRSVWTIALLSLFVGFATILASCVCLQKEITGFTSGKGTLLVIMASLLTGGFFPVLAHALNELNLLTSEVAQLSLSCSMINELFWWIGQVLYILLLVKDESYIFALASTAFILFTAYVLRPLMLWIVKSTPEGRPVKQIFVVTVWLTALLMGFVSSSLSGNFVMGIVSVGFVVPDGPPLGSAIVEKTEHILSELFLPMFYLMIGYEMDISTMINLTDFSLLHFIVIMGLLGKILGCLVASLFFKIKLGNAIKLGLVLCLKGTVELVVLKTLRTNHFINDSIYTSLVVAITLVVALITPLVEIFCKPYISLDLSSSFDQPVRSLQSTSKNEELRILSCIHREDNLNSFLPLFEASNTIQKRPLCVYIIHLIELIGRAAPDLVQYSEKGKGFIPSSSHRIMRACMNFTGSIPSSIMFHFFTLTAPYKSMHESVCRIAKDEWVPLIIVPFHENQNFDATTGYLRHFNTNTQMFASCTVGILVDRRGQLSRMQGKTAPFKICLIFLGGPDDREALVFVARMSSQKNVAITLLRIDYSEYSQVENKSDRLLDQMVLDEFKAMSVETQSVVYKKIMAEEPMELINSVRSLNGDYDLVVVGQRRGDKMKFEHNLVDWIEFPELGVIGDELISSDRCGGSVPVLVMRHPGGLSPTQRLGSSKSIQRLT